MRRDLKERLKILKTHAEGHGKRTEEKEEMIRKIATQRCRMDRGQSKRTKISVYSREYSRGDVKAI